MTKVTLRYNNPRHQNTMVVNQAYTFNGTTPNANVSYAPGTLNKGTPFNTYQAPCNSSRTRATHKISSITTTRLLSKAVKHHSRMQQQ